MMRSRARFVFALLLPLLVFRALVPAGFMPTRGPSGQISVALCHGVVGGRALRPAGIPEAVADPAAPGGKSAHQPGSGHHALCPFALSAGPAVAPAPAMPGTTPTRIDPAPAVHYLTIAIGSIERAQTARAPPFATGNLI